MVEGPEHFSGVQFAVAIEIAEYFLLLGVDAQQWIGRIKILLFEIGDVQGLSIAVGMFAHVATLLGLSAAIGFRFEQRLDKMNTHQRIRHLAQLYGDVRGQSNLLKSPPRSWGRQRCDLARPHETDSLTQEKFRVSAFCRPFFPGVRRWNIR